MSSTSAGMWRRANGCSTSKRGFTTRKAAQDALTTGRAREGGNRGEFVRPSKGTLGEYLTEQWLLTERLELRESTFHGYEKQVRTKVIANIGAVALSKLDGRTRAVLHLPADGRRGAGSAAVVEDSPEHCRDLVFGALRRDEAPANRTQPVRRHQVAGRREARDAHLVRTGRRGVHGAYPEFRLWPLWRLALATGLRRGELCGLRWGDVSFDDGTIYVGHTRHDRRQGRGEHPRRQAQASARSASTPAPWRCYERGNGARPRNDWRPDPHRPTLRTCSPTRTAPRRIRGG